MNLDDSSDLHESQTIKDLHLHKSCERLDASKAEEFLEKANIQNCLALTGQDLEGFVSDDSKIWDIPNVLIYSVGWVHPRQLTRFTGKNVCINIMDDNDDIRQNMNAFLKHWLKSGNTNLETMIVCGDFKNQEELFDGIQTNQWDPKKRPAIYVIKEPCANFVPWWPQDVDCTNAFDIVRESDGLIASVKLLHGVFFTMCVWHSTFS
ncbi:unnamed protein product [Caenorhabditis nigoni]